jgi:polysaccharide biosynthesis/export protein
MKLRRAIGIFLLITASFAMTTATAEAGQLTSSISAPAAATAAGAQPQADTQSADHETADARYRIQLGDSFEVNFPFVSSFNQTVTVQRDGYVSLRMVGDVRVVGLTAPALAEVLRGRYASILRDPVLTVELRDFEKPYFVAAGELERPGKYDLRGHTTLMQALAIAGGFKEKAKRTHVVVFRRSPNGPQTVKAQEINARQVLEGKAMVKDVSLESGDLIFVSKSSIPDAATFASTVLPNLGWLAYIIVNRR